MQRVKFYASPTARGLAPACILVDGKGKPVVNAHGKAERYEPYRRMSGSIGYEAWEVRPTSYARGRLRITEAQARKLDSEYHYGSMEFLPGRFFERELYQFLPDEELEGWAEYLDEGQQVYDFKIHAKDVAIGDRVRVWVYDTKTSGRKHMEEGEVVSIQPFTTDVYFHLKSGSKSCYYGAHEHVIQVQKPKQYTFDDAMNLAGSALYRGDDGLLIAVRCVSSYEVQIGGPATSRKDTIAGRDRDGRIRLFHHSDEALFETRVDVLDCVGLRAYEYAWVPIKKD